MAGRFLIAFDTLALRATACALSVTAYAVPPLPKGEARAVAGTFLLHLNFNGGADGVRPLSHLR